MTALHPSVPNLISAIREIFERGWRESRCVSLGLSSFEFEEPFRWGLNPSCCRMLSLCIIGACIKYMSFPARAAGLKTMSKIRVLLADDHKVVREGLRALLEATPEIEVVGEADTGHAA